MLRKRLVLSASIADSAIHQLVLACATLGAAQPADGVRVFSSCFPADRDWSAEDNRRLLDSLTEDAERVSMTAAVAAAAPYRAFIDVRFEKFGAEIPWETLDLSSVQEVIQWACAQATYWGTIEPGGVTAWYRCRAASQSLSVDEMRAAGLHLGEDFSGDFEQMAAASVSVLGEYESEVGRLANASSSLLAYPRIQTVAG